MMNYSVERGCPYNAIRWKSHRYGMFPNDLAEIHSKDDALTALIHLGYLDMMRIC